MRLRACITHQVIFHTTLRRARRGKGGGDERVRAASVRPWGYSPRCILCRGARPSGPGPPSTRWARAGCTGGPPVGGDRGAVGQGGVDARGQGDGAVAERDRIRQDVRVGGADAAEEHARHHPGRWGCGGKRGGRASATTPNVAPLLAPFAARNAVVRCSSRQHPRAPKLAAAHARAPLAAMHHPHQSSATVPVAPWLRKPQEYVPLCAGARRGRVSAAPARNDCRSPPPLGEAGGRERRARSLRPLVAPSLH